MRPLIRNVKLVRRLVAAGLGLGLILVPALAAAQTVTQSYSANSGVQQGMIVMLDNKDSGKVDPLTADNIQSMQGVVVAANDSTVTLSNGSTNQVYVATTGTYNVLVSNQNGEIKKGDFITISSLAGIGMRANGDQLLVLGKALQSFDGTTNVSGTARVATTTGGTTNVSLGLISVDIGISHNPLMPGATASVPGFLGKTAQNIVNKPVSTSRLYISLVVLLLTVVIVGTFMYGGVRSGVTAIGRNPLAKSSITKGLLQVTLVGLIIFVMGLFAVYLILKL